MKHPHMAVQYQCRAAVANEAVEGSRPWGVQHATGIVRRVLGGFTRLFWNPGPEDLGRLQNEKGPVRRGAATGKPTPNRGAAELPRI